MYGKDRHGLWARDVDHKDKQNYDAVLHIVKAAHLLWNVPDVVGTKVFSWQIYQPRKGTRGNMVTCILGSLDNCTPPLHSANGWQAY